jgi:polyhydroxybutyrate depolymerase
MTAAAALLRSTLAAAVFAAVAPAASAEPIERQVRVGASQRSYEIDVPARRDPQRPLPVVLVFHGGGGNAASVRTQSRLSAKGDAEGFVAVYPQGSGGIGGRLKTWNAGTCCGAAMQRHVDDIAFVAALLDDLAATVAIDRSRIYATGISNGGMMAYEIACALGDRIAAIAVVAGEMTALDRCRPTRPVPVLVIHGSADRNLPLAGGRGAKAVAVPEGRGVAAAVEFWRRHDGCAESPGVEQRGGVRHSRYSACSNDSAVELIEIEGGGHSWPGGDRLARFLDAPSSALDASDEIWRFFSRHRATPAAAAAPVETTPRPVRE